MHQNMINSNPIVHKFNGYITNNPTTIPFSSNKLINENVHVVNNLNTYVQQQKNVQETINKGNILKPKVQERIDNSGSTKYGSTKSGSTKSGSTKSQKKNINI